MPMPVSSAVGEAGGDVRRLLNHAGSENMALHTAPLDVAARKTRLPRFKGMLYWPTLWRLAGSGR